MTESEESELKNLLVNFSKLLSLMLRHEPQRFGLVLAKYFDR